MPPLPTAVFILALALVAVYVACVLAKDLAVLFLRAIGHLPQAAVYGTPRSGKWQTFERKWLDLHPSCAACGGKEDCHGHHKRPFHLEPEKELDPDNIITLCNHRCCHLLIGHGGDWHAYNPHVEPDAALILKRVQNRRYE